MLRILVDEDMPRPTAGLIQSLGIDAIDLRDVGLKGATDAEAFGYAQKQEMIIIVKRQRVWQYCEISAGNASWNHLG
jgi:predicted nuclease of predicted toxin-antitoxin system